MCADSSRSARAELSAVLSAFERATGRQVCLRPLSTRWRDADGVDISEKPFHEHRSAFCQAAKRRSPRQCMKCDNTDLPGVCSPPGGPVLQPLVRTCHAGADELLIPLWTDGVLVGVLFVGQFTTNPARPTGENLLGRIDGAELRHLLTLALTMRSYLLDVLRKLDKQRLRDPDGRRGVIESYIRSNLTAGPSLSELATKLSLSRSRASHVVREATGRSFRDLVDDRRVAVARDLLVNTEGTVAWVAHQTGFGDIGYFCRYFKSKTGTTPTAYRRRYQRAPAI
jgi:AraC-like DNA-binding protein